MNRSLLANPRFGGLVIPAVLLLALAAGPATAQEANESRYEYDAAGNRLGAGGQLRPSGPRIFGFHPDYAPAGGRFNIYGDQFPAAGSAEAQVFLGGTALTVVAVSPTAIAVELPPSAETGPLSVRWTGSDPIDLGIYHVGELVDEDADGIPDFLESSLGLSPGSGDSDGDGIPDGDEDADGDGLSNRGELAMRTALLNPDTDRDGVPDGEEDTDFDFVSDGGEFRNGTDPFLADTDGDGVADVDELGLGSDAALADSVPPVFARSRAVAYLNAIVLPAPGAAAAVSSPVSYLNAQIGAPEDIGFAASVSVSYLNAVLETPSGNRFQASPVVGYENRPLEN